jgi:hypothetical protein
MIINYFTRVFDAKLLSPITAADYNCISEDEGCILTGNGCCVILMTHKLQDHASIIALWYVSLTIQETYFGLTLPMVKTFTLLDDQDSYYVKNEIIVIKRSDIVLHF